MYTRIHKLSIRICFLILSHVFVCFFSLLIKMKFYVLSSVYIVLHAHTHTHTYRKERPGFVPIQHKAGEWGEGGGGGGRHHTCVVSFFFCHTHQHTGTQSIGKRKERIVHCTYYTIHNRGGVLFYRGIYSYHTNSFFLFSFFSKSHFVFFLYQLTYTWDKIKKQIRIDNLWFLVYKSYSLLFLLLFFYWWILYLYINIFIYIWVDTTKEREVE